KVRAELLDEGLDIITRLWAGEPFGYNGIHYQISPPPYPHPAPVQKPRIPIWVVGMWPHEKSVKRALRWDGWVTATQKTDGPGFAPITPDDIREMKAYVDANRPVAEPFDIVVEGESPLGDPQQAAAHVRSYAEAGATWWIESLWEHPQFTYLEARLRQGPPSIR
ncbi:MAG: LLM class flavin-dependent oxidoreductase, partial [Chloroflexi bacterium]